MRSAIGIWEDPAGTTRVTKVFAACVTVVDDVVVVTVVELVVTLVAV